MAVANSASGVVSPVTRESQVRMRQAIIAGGAGVCLLAAATVQTTSQPKVSELTVELITISQHTAQEVIGGVLNAIGFLGLAFTVAFLFQASRARRPETAPATRIAALVGGGLAAVGGVAYAIVLSIKANDFVSAGTQTYLEAKNLVGTAPVAALQYAGLVGSLLLAIAFALVSMNAMRVGLLTKFLGYLGIVAAASSLFLAGSPIGLLIEVFWLVAVAYLLAGRWPGGDPKAWITGAAEPWPTAAQVREQRQGAGGGKPAGRSAASGKSASSKPAPRRPQAGSAEQGTRATTPKRKRKRRK
jgi:hypothetical protein